MQAWRYLGSHILVSWEEFGQIFLTRFICRILIEQGEAFSSKCGWDVCDIPTQVLFPETYATSQIWVHFIRRIISMLSFILHYIHNLWVCIMKYFPKCAITTLLRWGSIVGLLADDVQEWPLWVSIRICTLRFVLPLGISIQFITICDAGILSRHLGTCPAASSQAFCKQEPHLSTCSERKTRVQLHIKLHLQQIDEDEK